MDTYNNTEHTLAARYAKMNISAIKPIRCRGGRDRGRDTRHGEHAARLERRPCVTLRCDTSLKFGSLLRLFILASLERGEFGGLEMAREQRIGRPSVDAYQVHMPPALKLRLHPQSAVHTPRGTRCVISSACTVP